MRRKLQVTGLYFFECKIAVVLPFSLYTGTKNQNAMKKILILFFTLLPFLGFSQTVNVKIQLNANEGGVHANMPVTLVNTSTKEEYKGRTDAKGTVIIAVPPNASYQVLIPNYTEKKFINVPNAPGATMSSTMTYSRNMVEEDKAFAMNDEEKAQVDAFANALPDTTFFTGTNPFRNSSNSFYTSLDLGLSNLDKGPLAGEKVTLTGRKRHKSFKGTTDAKGHLLLYLPKGDDYDLSFTYHKNFEYTECKYSKGSSEETWDFEYIGTKEYLRKKKEEEAKQAAEAKAMAEAKARREQEAKAAYSENRIAAVMDKNQFRNPLIICDASAEMQQITLELSQWFTVNAQKNPNSQFVFFNDGDQKQEKDKKIGSTGGIYYTPSLPPDKLAVFMNNVMNKSNDNDAPDNYMEALIEGVKMAKQPFDDIILIVDNHATVRDIELLSQFNHPVHVVVFCSIRGGCDYSFCQPDFLKIAWKTKGSLHISGHDFNDIGNMKSGETIEIGPGKMKLVNGEFFQL